MKRKVVLDSCDFPPDIGGSVRQVISSQIVVSFPLIEKLCHEIFDSNVEMEES